MKIVILKINDVIKNNVIQFFCFCFCFFCLVFLCFFIIPYSATRLFPLDLMIQISDHFYIILAIFRKFLIRNVRKLTFLGLIEFCFILHVRVISDSTGSKMSLSVTLSPSGEEMLILRNLFRIITNLYNYVPKPTRNFCCVTPCNTIVMIQNAKHP